MTESHLGAATYWPPAEPEPVVPLSVATLTVEALERTDQTLRALLAGTPVRDADEVLSANALLLCKETAPVSRGRCAAP